MTSYLRGWLFAQPPADLSSQPTIAEIPPQEPEDDDDDTDTIHGGDIDDTPPSFPSLSSAQRIASREQPERILSDAQLMPPPPLRMLSQRQLGVPSSSHSLALPPTTTKPPTKPGRRGKVMLAPGHGPLDWASLKKSGRDLRGVDTLLRVTPSMLKLHNKREDAWSCFNGKVYNITPYLPFHPGGEKELMRVAGRDGSKLFALTHAWVNLDYMLEGCMVGFMVPE